MTQLLPLKDYFPFTVYKRYLKHAEVCHCILLLHIKTAKTWFPKVRSVLISIINSLQVLHNVEKMLRLQLV